MRLQTIRNLGFIELQCFFGSIRIYSMYIKVSVASASYVVAYLCALLVRVSNRFK